MLAYIKSNVDFATKDILQFDKYDFSQDIEYSEKSSITVLKKPNVVDDDFVIVKDGNEVVFIGICEDYSTDEASGYTINLLQKECLFDRKIFVGSEALIQSTGIEDFIKKAIEDNWTASGDTLLDKAYINVVASTHTPISATVDAEDGIYNLKTFLGNAKEYYGIFTAFTYTDSTLTITISKDSSASLPIDVTVSDVSGYTETYNVDVLAKLITKWKNTSTEAVSTLTYYLKTDRTTTTNASDPNRAHGIISSKYVECETQAEAVQEILNEFKSNTYEHKITFDLYKHSKAYPPAMYYVGRKATIKTKTGIQTSLITGISYSSESSFISFKFGKLKVSLLEKLRTLGGAK